MLVPDDSDGKTTHFLDLEIPVEDNNVTSTSIFNKRDHFDFTIVNFPSLCGNIPHQSSYGVFVGELVRYARACTYSKAFIDRTMTLTAKLKKQHFTDKLLKISWDKFCKSHIFLIQKYGPTIIDLF